MASLLSRAVRLLSAREHTRAELRTKLSRPSRSATAFAEADPDGARPPAIDPAELEAVLDRLEVEGLQSDRRFAEAWIRQHQARHGRLRLALDLRQRGVADEMAAELLAGLAIESPSEDRAWQVWSRRFSEPPATPAGRARQLRFLLGRGFSPDDFRALERRRFAPPESG